MNHLFKSIFNMGMILLTFNAFSGCSASSVCPLTSDYPQCKTSPVSAITNHDGQYLLWGIYNIEFDFNEKQAVVEPLRSADTHYDITNMLIQPACDDCLKIKVNSFDPVTRILDAEVTLRNPTEMSGYDVRGILYTDDYGHELRNADDWTALFDIPGGEPLNPFKAFAKDHSKRMFAGEVSHTEQYLIYIPVPPHYEGIKFAVEASYPGNCREPYSIDNCFQKMIYDSADSNGMVTVEAHDWQDDVSKVTLVAPEITGEQYTQMACQSGDTWSVLLYNKTDAASGDYRVRIIGSSADSGSTALYDYFTLTISPAPPSNPVDVTPPWLNFSPKGICTDGNYLCLAAGVNGLHIFDVSGAGYPVWVNRVDTGGIARDVAVQGSYAYVADYYEGLVIIDIDPPESAYVVKTIETADYALSVALASGYAGVVGNYYGHDGWLAIIDINQPEYAFIANTVNMNAPSGIAMAEGYAYVGDESAGLQIIDIDPPESASVVKTIGDSAGRADISGGYLYVAAGVYGLQIIDITQPKSAYIIKTVETAEYARDIAVTEGYAYMADDSAGIQIVQIYEPWNAFIVESIGVPGSANRVALAGNSAYAIDYDSLHVINIDPPYGAYSTTIKTMSGAWCVATGGDYAYVADPANIKTVRIYPPESPCIVKTTLMQYDYVHDIALAGGYAYAIAADILHVIDIDPPESAFIVKTVDLAGEVCAVAVAEGYAYTAELECGVQIVDIDPPESAYVVKSVDTPGDASDIAVEGAYAYVADYSAGLQIIDINQPDKAFIAKSIDLQGKAYNVAVSGDYAYATGYTFSGADAFLAIIDICPLESAHVINSIESPSEWGGGDVAVAGGYAYEAIGNLRIYDIDPPEQANVTQVLYMPGTLDGLAEGVAINGCYAYVAARGAGLRIIKLW